MDLAHLSKHWTKQVEHELTQLFAAMGDSWVPHPLVEEAEENMSPIVPTTDGFKLGMDASGVVTSDHRLPRHH